jgi:antitoxin component YwqK of YwqJK toxin-antitoxin module
MNRLLVLAGLTLSMIACTDHMNGTKTSYYPNGQKKSDVTLVHGQAHGLVSGWYETGQVKSQVNHVNGQLQGLNNAWYENGQKSFEGNFDKGRPDGLQTKWYENGQRESELNYANGKQNGPAIFWFENGQVKSEGNFVVGRKHGLMTTWFENGQRKLEENYENGQLMAQAEWDQEGNEAGCPAILAAQVVHVEADKAICIDQAKKRGEGNEYLTYEGKSETPYTGRAIDFYADRQPREERRYVNGVQVGLEIRWYENGQKEVEATFVDGSPVKSIMWYESGQKLNEGLFVDGMPEGLFTTWHENGQKKSGYSNVHGRNTGIWTTWHDNGQKASERNYDLMQQKTWDRDGKLLSESP